MLICLNINPLINFTSDGVPEENETKDVVKAELEQILDDVVDSREKFVHEKRLIIFLNFV